MTAPTLTGLDAPTFAENLVNATPQVIDSDVTFTDPDNDFTGGTLTVSGLLAEDTVSILTGAVIYRVGADVFYDADGAGGAAGVIIGSAAGGAGATFTVTFNASATSAIVELVIESLTYANSSGAPTAARALTINVTDAAGGNLGGTQQFTESAGGSNPLNAFNFAVGTNTTPTVVDLNGDGLLDAVVGRNAGDFLYFQNTGSASTPAFTQITGGSSPFNGLNVADVSSTPVFADIDDDGDLDMISGSASGDLHLYENTGSNVAPAFTEITGVTNPFTAFNAAYNIGSERDTYVAVGDLDNDGDLDLIVSPNNGALHYLRNDGTAAAPSFTEVTGGGSPVDGISLGHGHAVLVDHDEDGDLDMVVGIYTGTVSFYENTGTIAAPVFVERTGSANPFGVLPDIGFIASFGLGDLDGDGDLDVVLGSENGTLRYFRDTTVPAPSITVTVTAQNDAPTASGLPSDVTVTEDVASNLDLSAISLNDVDSGSITVVLTASAGTMTATTGGGVTVSNSGTGALSLAGTASAIDTFLNTAANIQYTGASNVNGNNAATVTVTANDGTGAVTLGVVNVDITAVNDAPTLTGLAASVTFAENLVNHAGQSLDAAVTVSDAEGNYQNGTLVISGLLAEDTVAIRAQGAGATAISIDGVGSVFYGGVQIASTNSLTASTTGASLVATFAAGATAEAIEALIEALTYANSSDTPTASRDLTLTLTDAAADDVASVIAVNVTAQTDGPTALADLLFGTGGNDTINALAGVDIVDGGDGNDTVDGGEGDDVIAGGSGNDYLRGGIGADAMTGGTGNDTYVVDDAGDTTDETGGDGTDLVIAKVSWTLAAGLENLTLSHGASLTGTGNALANVITGSSVANTLNGLAGNDTLNGGGGNDILNGGDDVDVLNGETQNDTLNGGAGDDTLNGGAGHDTLDGGTGADVMAGGAGNDLYYIDEAGDSTAEAVGEGTDSVLSSIGATLGANVENLTLTGSAAIGGGNELANTITGNSVGNTLLGDAGADVLNGLAGDDWLHGGSGNDTLDGGADDDFLGGGAGQDRLTGGSGADTFSFNTPDIRRSGPGFGLTPEKDQILDLSFAANDRIDLSAIDANVNLASDQAFAFVAKFTNTAGQATLKASGGKTVLQLDVDGDGKADLVIEINGNLTGTTTNLYTGGGDTDGGWVL